MLLPPPRPDRRPALRRWLVVGLIAICFALGGLGMLLLVDDQSGIVATGIGLVLSMVVIGVVVPVFLWLDRFEREPTKLLVFALLWGACIATFVAAMVNNVGSVLIDPVTASHPSAATWVAPVVEESLKGLGPLLILFFRRREIDGVLDGMVYAGLTAAGFAAVEDVVYLAAGYAHTGEQGLVATFIVRVVMSPFAHPMFTVCTGIGIGIAATTPHRALRYLAPFAGWCCAVTLHGVWNLGAVLSQHGWLVFYVVLQLPLFVGFVTLIVLARRHEASLIARELGRYVDSGALTTSEVAMLSSIKERSYALAWAERHGGAESRSQMRELQDAASELAMVRARVDRGDTSAAVLREEQHLLELVGVLRVRFLDSALYRYYEDRGLTPGPARS
ncbi:PrsW family intramembrane metalloprotease [Flexivirga oryzae]|uniref:RsiW-degrading membrane proteinase PrsW (M82 family) n=1 Tax=Flexivirga oryzae TaxID=1794944 RepID=A0A839N0N5_9MICO|nr:PrsW family intramembrane metalloprotease [Flexivirga oryzae]MBB2890389.1 RsiW-degrading membrane proteinase PrsW (M82 family) [Flexivirga oryzae]